MADDEDDTDTSMNPVMPKAAFLGLMAKRKDAQKTMDDARSKIGGLVSDAVERHNYHKGAGALMQKLDRLKPAERNEFLFQFDHYREYKGWNNEDLFRASPPKGRKPRLVAETDEEHQSA